MEFLVSCLKFKPSKWPDITLYEAHIFSSLQSCELMKLVTKILICSLCCELSTLCVIFLFVISKLSTDWKMFEVFWKSSIYF